jgi:hypothetical protein
MSVKKCPVCQGEQFYRAKLKSFGPLWLRVGLMGWYEVHGQVCLACGFVAPCVDDSGLVAIRAKARKEEMAIKGNPGAEALREP